MIMGAESFDVTIKMYSNEYADAIAVRYATFEDVEEVYDFLHIMADFLSPDDEVEVTADVKYRKINHEAGYLIGVEIFKTRAQFLARHLEDL